MSPASSAHPQGTPGSWALVSSSTPETDEFDCLSLRFTCPKRRADVRSRHVASLPRGEEPSVVEVEDVWSLRG